MLFRTILTAALLTGAAAADDRLTPAQRSQIANPDNPQFAPPWQPTILIDQEDQTAYVFPDIPDEPTKVWALKRAFQLNGNSMVGSNRMIDVSKETPFATVVPTERVTVTLPTPTPSPAAQLAAMKPVPSDVCTRHGMHKVTHGGSWRCKR